MSILSICIRSLFIAKAENDMRLFLSLVLTLALVSCGKNEPSTPPPMAAPIATAQSATVAPSATSAPTTPPEPTKPPQPTATVQPQPIPTEQLADLVATSVAAIPPTPTADANGSLIYQIDGAQALALTGPGIGLAALFSTGARRMDPQQNHFVAIYARDGQGWRELSRLELENPDYVDPSGVQQVEITPDGIWLTLESGVGAHSGCFNLLSFDGKKLTSALDSCSSSPGAGGIHDIDGDGRNEVLLDGTDYYVNCYACGLRIFHTTVMRWDGTEFKQLALTDLPGTTELATANNQAVALAKGNRWKEALLAVAKMRDLAKGDPIARTNIGLIELDGNSFAEQAANTDLSPPMPSIFYGDYATALEYLRGKPVADLFEVERSQIFGEQAQGFEANKPGYITTTIEPALVLDPTLAPAHFLEGWALILANPSDPKGLAEIERAATLDPQEKLYADCVAYLKAKG
jgi:hypothetical protein